MARPFGILSLLLIDYLPRRTTTTAAILWDVDTTQKGDPKQKEEKNDKKCFYTTITLIQTLLVRPAWNFQWDIFGFAWRYI